MHIVEQLAELFSSLTGCARPGYGIGIFAGQSHTEDGLLIEFERLIHNPDGSFKRSAQLTISDSPKVLCPHNQPCSSRSGPRTHCCIQVYGGYRELEPRAVIFFRMSELDERVASRMRRIKEVLLR